MNPTTIDVLLRLAGCTPQPATPEKALPDAGRADVSARPMRVVDDRSARAAMRARLKVADWPGLLRLARANRVLGLVRSAVERGDVDCPADVRAALKDEFFLLAAGNLAADRAFGDALGALRAASVPCLPLKGALFRHLLYDDPAERLSVDADLLVTSGDYERSHRVLLDAGFEAVEGPAGRDFTNEQFHERSFRHPALRNSGALIEVHEGISQLTRYRGSYADLWARVRTFGELRERAGCKGANDSPIPGDQPVMSPEDLLLHQFVHNANHSFDIPLHSVLDAARIAARLSPDWDLVVALAREWDATAAGYLTLRLARDLAHAPVTDSAMEALRPAWPRERWLRYFVLDRPVLRAGDDLGMLRFSRCGWNMRLQQAAVLLPLLDGNFNRLRFLAYYARLRLRDFVA